MKYIALKWKEISKLNAYKLITFTSWLSFNNQQVIYHFITLLKIVPKGTVATGFLKFIIFIDILLAVIFSPLLLPFYYQQFLNFK